MTRNALCGRANDPTGPRTEQLWKRNQERWRNPQHAMSVWGAPEKPDPASFRFQVIGDWEEVLASTRSTLLVSREYEHLVMAIRYFQDGLRMSYLELPHPSGIAVDYRRGLLHIAATRNPNQVFDLAPVSGRLERADIPSNGRHQFAGERFLLPVRSRFFPGSLYLHDLAMVGGRLHANAVGMNAVVRLMEDGTFQPVWWPRSIEKRGTPMWNRNYLQLNSIAAGPNLGASFFSASSEVPSRRCPGHQDFPVDRRGVIFGGASREPVAWGLTRPHSARLHAGRLWIDDSGYGEFGWIEEGAFCSLIRLPGWTRGLCFHKQIAFIGTSRVLPRFRQYAPGLDVGRSQCGVHAVDLRTGRSLGSLLWPGGNQIFSLELVPCRWTDGFPHTVGRSSELKVRHFYYSSTWFSPPRHKPSSAMGRPIRRR